MVFSRCVLLWLLAACGSQHATTLEPQIGKLGSGVLPATAKPVAIAFVFEGWEMFREGRTPNLLVGGKAIIIRIGRRTSILKTELTPAEVRANLFIQLDP